MSAADDTGTWRDAASRRTPLLMAASAAVLAAAGLAASFAPHEILAALGASPTPGSALLVQLLGAPTLGIAMLDWMARGSLIGGIYGRPVAVGNLAQFTVAALALAKALLAGTRSPALVAAAVVTAALALWFGVVLVTHPRPRG